MEDFEKAVNVLRSQGIDVEVENYVGGTQLAKIEGKGMVGGMANKMNSVTFDEEEVNIIRELLSDVACGYKREEYFYHCCDVNDIIEKIDRSRKVVNM